MTSITLPPLKHINCEGRRIAWRETGQGDALVLIHGIGGSSASWAHQFFDFAASHRVVAWDAPGYGGSAPLRASPGAEAYAESLVAWLDALGIRKASLVGHSLGSLFVAIVAARLRPDLVERALFLQPVTGNGRLPSEEREAVRQGRIRDMATLGPQAFAEQRGGNILARGIAPEVATHAIAVMAGVPEQGYLAAWDAMCEGNIFPLLSAIICPVIVVCGSEDPVSPEATGREIVSGIKDAKFELLSGVGHYASIEAPDRLRGILVKFLA